MYCPNCGKEMEDNSVCQECGFEYNKTDDTEQEKPDKEVESKQVETESANNIIDSSSVDYLNALRIIEAEKAEKAEAEKKAKKKKQKKVIIIVVLLLAVVALVVGGIFVAKAIKTSAHELDSVKFAAKSNADYEQSYNEWETKNNPSDTKKKKSLLKLGKYSFDNDNLEAGLYFFDLLNKMGDENYDKKAVSEYDSIFNDYSEKDKYNDIITCVDSYEKLGGIFDAGIIENGITKLTKSGKFVMAESVVDNAERVEIKLSEETKSKVEFSSLSVEYIGNVKANEYVVIGDFNAYGIYSDGSKRKLESNEYKGDKVKCEYGKSFDYTITETKYGNKATVKINTPKKAFIKKTTREKLAESVFKAIKDKGQRSGYKITYKKSSKGIITSATIESTNKTSYIYPDEYYTITFIDSENNQEEFSKVTFEYIPFYSLRGSYSIFADNYGNFNYVAAGDFYEIAPEFVKAIDSEPDVKWNDDKSSKTISYKYDSIKTVFTLVATAIENDIEVII